MRLSPADRNAIGGDILLWELRAFDKGEVRSSVQKVYRFPTRAEDMGIIRQKVGMAAADHGTEITRHDAHAQ
jgi:hypothetical protein